MHDPDDVWVPIVNTHDIETAQIEAKIEITGKAQIAQMQPGDILIIQIDTPNLKLETIERLQEAFKKEIPDVRVIVLDRSFMFSVVRTA